MKSSLSLLAGVLTLVSAASAQAQTTYTYTGATGGIWSTTSNWNPSTGYPGTGGVAGNTDVGVLDTTATTRNVNYDASSSGFLGTLTINQSSAVVNSLTLQRSLTLTNALTLGASSGTAEISDGAFTLTDAAGIAVNTGGNITMTGNGTISGAVTLAGGALALGNTTTTFATNLTATSGSINNGTGILNLGGATNSLTGLTGSTLHNVSFTDNGVASVSLVSNVALTGTTSIIVNNSNGGNNELVNIAGAGGASLSIGAVTLNSSANFKTAELQLGSDLSSGAITNAGSGGSANAAWAIDANGHTLTIAASFAPTNNAGSTHNAYTLTDSGTGGVIKANSFDLSAVTTGGNGVVVQNDVTLNATATASANNLGTAASTGISTTSTFAYSGSATQGAAATLVAGRQIGNLKVTNGFLNVNQSSTSVAGTTGVNISSGGGLMINGGGTNLGSLTLSSTAAGSFTVNNGTLELTLGSGTGAIGGSDFILGNNGTFSLTNLTLNIDQNTGFSTSTSYQVLVGFATSAADLNITTNVSGFNGNIDSAGFLTFSAVPEPSTWALLLGGFAVLLLGQRMRRRSA